MSVWSSNIEFGQFDRWPMYIISPIRQLSMDKDLMPEDEHAGESKYVSPIPPLPTVRVEVEGWSSDDLLPMLEGKQAGESNYELCPPPSRDRAESEHGEQPGNVEICPPPSWDRVEAEHGEQPGNVETKEFKFARALARFTAEGFDGIIWIKYLCIFSKYMDELDTFCVELFGAMARFVWNLYDEEDFENIEFTDNIFNECERIRQLVWSKENCELDLSLLDTSEYEKVREQDVCNLLRWYNEKKSRNNSKLTEEVPEFKREDVLYQEMRNGDFSDCSRLVDISRDAMLSSEILDPKGAVKQQLRMELIEDKCSCIVDALYMQSWKHMNFQKLVALIPAHDHESLECLQLLAGMIHEQFYWLVDLRKYRLNYCERLVTYPLSAGNIFGSWDSEVLEVVKQADLKRRSEGRRFIGTYHLVFCLHQRLVSESTHAKNSNVLMSSDDDEEKDTVYHLYRKANKIATKLGHETIGLEHLYVAIITSANNDKCSWKDYVERVKKAKTKRKGKCKKQDKPHPDLWKFILEGKSIDAYNWDVEKKILDKSNISLQRAIKDVLFEDNERTHQMSQGEMISSLKKNIEMNYFQYFAAGRLSIVIFVAASSYILKQHKRGSTWS